MSLWVLTEVRHKTHGQRVLWVVNRVVECQRLATRVEDLLGVKDYSLCSWVSLTGSSSHARNHQIRTDGTERSVGGTLSSPRTHGNAASKTNRGFRKG